MTQTTASVRVAAFARAALVAAVVIILDQVTKSLVRSDIPLGDHRRFLPGIITFVHDRNTGVAFTLFAGGGALVLVVTFAALALLIGYFAIHPGRALLWLPTGMLVGGAIGNLIDRIARGGVTDFIQLPHWPAFNVADISITFGVLTLLWVLEGPRAKQ